MELHNGNGSKNMKNYTWFLWPAGIVIAILLCYFKILDAGINDWDDATYVFNNKDIMAITSGNISRWFTNFYIGNYHPLTMFSYAIDWQLGVDDPFFYHLTNLLLHIFNAIMIWLLVQRIVDHPPIAFFVALIFAIHPVQTESVSWIAERKNVLYAAFFLTSCLSYISYVRTQKKSMLGAALFLCVCSMLSKAAALSLPVSLLAIDILMKRKLNNKTVWLEKVPFYIAAVVLGIIGIEAQKAGGFLDWHRDIGLTGKIGLAGYAYSSYIFTLFAPVSLSVWYPYPDFLAPVHLLAVFFAALIIALAVYAYRKKYHILSGSILFFSCNIFLVLQLVQFGEALRADRYLYLPSLGIILPAVYYPVHWARKHSKQLIAYAVFALFSALLMFATFQRNEIWLSELNFWGAVVERFPNSGVANYSMGAAYLREGDYINAAPHMDAAVAAEPYNYKAWFNKGVLHLRQNQLPAALDALNRAIAIEPYTKALFTRALVYQQAGDYVAAIRDAEMVLSKEPEHARAHFILADGLEQQLKIDKAVEHYSKALEFEAGEAMFYMRRGIAYAKLRNFTSALKDLDQAVIMRPGNGAGYYWRGMVKNQTGHNPCKDFQAAASLNFQPAMQALRQFCATGK
jgi:tetratricopeptide (TPR) repeat protein